jgi:hypothetical protein
MRYTAVLSEEERFGIAERPVWHGRPKPRASNSAILPPDRRHRLRPRRREHHRSYRTPAARGPGRGEFNGGSLMRARHDVGWGTGARAGVFDPLTGRDPQLHAVSRLELRVCDGAISPSSISEEDLRVVGKSDVDPAPGRPNCDPEVRGAHRGVRVRPCGQVDAHEGAHIHGRTIRWLRTGGRGAAYQQKEQGQWRDSGDHGDIALLEVLLRGCSISTRGGWP